MRTARTLPTKLVSLSAAALLSTAGSKAAQLASLAERLGYKPTDKLLVVNGDDAGMCHAANLATTECLAGVNRRGIAENGSITFGADPLGSFDPTLTVLHFRDKSGDVGMVLSVPGVDYESLDRSGQEYAVKRLEAALKAFGPGFHIYQYLFKSNRPDIPFAKYDDPIVEAAIEQRRKFFEAKRDHLYQVEIFYCILLEGARSKTGVGAAFARFFRDPAGALGELKAQFTSDSMKTLLRSHIEHDVRRLDHCVQAFVRQLADFMPIEVLDRQGQFTFFRRLLNYDDWRVAGKPQSTQFLDYQVVNSNH